jgi:hypothetical protein
MLLSHAITLKDATVALLSTECFRQRWATVLCGHLLLLSVTISQHTKHKKQALASYTVHKDGLLKEAFNWSEYKSWCRMMASLNNGLECKQDHCQYSSSATGWKVGTGGSIPGRSKGLSLPRHPTRLKGSASLLSNGYQR